MQVMYLSPSNIIPLVKNMYLITADLLLIFNGCPLSISFLHTILLVFTLCNTPVATNVCEPANGTMMHELVYCYKHGIIKIQIEKVSKI